MKPRYAILLLALFVLWGCDSEQRSYDMPHMELPGAEHYQKGLSFLIDGESGQALPWLEKAVAVGNPEAQYQLGLLYARGDGVEQNFNRAHEWLMKAALQGHPKSQYHLGHMYGLGDGVEKDYEEAFVWFWLAASYGDKGSKYFMRVLVQKLNSEQYNRAEKRVHELWDQMPHDTFMSLERMPMHN